MVREVCQIAPLAAETTICRRLAAALNYTSIT
jgi:hypothetical protein